MCIRDSSYSGTADYTGYDTDSDLTTFNFAEQSDILRSWEHVTQYFAMFDVNVTTDDAARAASTAWGWILITEEESGGRASTSTAAIGTPAYARAYAGSSTVRDNDRSRRIAHELGHNFTLEHNGAWDGSTFYKWEDFPSWDGLFGSIMGGGGDGVVNGWALGISSDGIDIEQDSMAIIEQRVRTLANSPAGWAVDQPEDPQPLCDDIYQVSRTAVLGHPQDQDAFAFEWRGGSALIEVAPTEVSSADPVLTVFDSGDNVLGGPGYYPDLAPGTYRVVVQTRSDLPNGYDTANLGGNGDVGRSELGAYRVRID